MAVPRPFSTPRAGSPTPGACGRASSATSRFSRLETRSPPAGVTRPSMWSTRRSKEASRSANVEDAGRDPSGGVEAAGVGGSGRDSLTSIFPRPFDSTVRVAPSCRRSRTERTKFRAASCTFSTSIGEPRSAVFTRSAMSWSARYAVESLSASRCALSRTLRGRPLEESRAAPSNSRGNSASISSGTSTIRASGRAIILTVNTLQSYDDGSRQEQ